MTAPDPLAALCRARWERGRRVHGLWDGNTRLARVGLTPRIPGGGPVHYRWSVDLPWGESGECSTLREAKAAALAALQRGLRGG